VVRGALERMAESFFERPILNSPYEIPKLHHALDKEGQPLDEPPVEGRRRSELITPVPKPRKKKNKASRTASSLKMMKASRPSSRNTTPPRSSTKSARTLRRGASCRTQPTGA
jgi:hypothetical protein